MINIVLVCAGGMSTSLLVNKMKAAAKEMAVDVNIVAMGADEFDDNPIPTDVLLIAPQIGFRANELMERYGNNIRLIETIDKIEYGLMNGKKVLTRILDSLS